MPELRASPPSGLPPCNASSPPSSGWTAYTRSAPPNAPSTQPPLPLPPSVAVLHHVPVFGPDNTAIACAAPLPTYTRRTARGGRNERRLRGCCGELLRRRSGACQRRREGAAPRRRTEVARVTEAGMETMLAPITVTKACGMHFAGCLEILYFLLKRLCPAVNAVRCQ